MHYLAEAIIVADPESGVMKDIFIQKKSQYICSILWWRWKSRMLHNSN